MSKEVVIARYKEDLGRVKDVQEHFDSAIVYNKFDGDNLLPNIGREVHTFVYHICNNYYDIKDHTCFLQGDPFPHCSDVITKIANYDGSVTHIGRIQHIENENGYPARPPHQPLLLGYRYKVLFGKERKQFPLYSGGQRFVPKEAITNRPISFWENLLDMLENHKDVGKNRIEYVLERMWPYIWGVLE